MRHVVIPARYASSRLPGKPLLDIHGKPMVLRVVDQARKVRGIDDLCVATDDDRIAEVCRQAGVEVVMTDKSHPSGTDRLSEVARLRGWGRDDIVVNVQGDEPLLPSVLVEQVAELLVNKPNCAMATLCEPISHVDEFTRSSIVKVVTTNQQEALYFSRATVPFDRDGFAQGVGHVPSAAMRHLGLCLSCGVVARFCDMADGCTRNTRKLRATACIGKWSADCDCASFGLFATGCGYARGLGTSACA